MANIDSYLQKIMNATYGEEVRGSIYDALVAMNTESTNAMLTEADIAEMGFTKNEGTYNKPADGIPESDLSANVREKLNSGGGGAQLTEADIAEMGFTKNEGTYNKPADGIPESDLSDSVKSKLNQTIDAVSFIEFTLRGKSPKYSPIAEPSVITEFMAEQEGVGLPSPTNIRPITPVAGLSLIINDGEPLTAVFGAGLGAGYYDWNTGKLTKTYHYKVFTGAENVGLFHASTSNGFTTIEYEIDAGGAPYGAPSGNSYCSHLGAARGGYSHGYNFCGLGAGSNDAVPKARRYIFAYNGTPTEFKNYLQAQYAAGTPVTIVYEMVSAVEIDLTPTEIPYTEGENTATGDGVLTVSGKMAPASVFGSDELIGSYGILKGKTAVVFGDSLVGNPPAGLDYPTYLARYTGMNIINVGFGGTRMAVVNDSDDGTRPALSMQMLAEAINSDDWTDVDARIAAHPSSYEIDTWGTSTDYAAARLAELKTLDWQNVDYVLIGHGTNDYTSSVPLEDSDDKYADGTFKGALRSAIESLLGRYNHLQIALISPPWRWWNRNTDGGNTSGDGENYEDSDTRENALSLKLTDYVRAMGEVAAEYHLPFLDLYNGCGWNADNRYEYFALYDGTHPFPHGEGYKMMAKIISGFLRAPEGYALIGSSITEEMVSEWGFTKNVGTYVKPQAGIPESDLDLSVQAKLNSSGGSGADGYSPTVAVTEIEGGHRVTITDADGPHVFDVLDGAGATYPPEGGIPESDLSSAVREKLNNESGTTENIHYHSSLKNAVDDANANFANDETATKSTAICKLTKLLNGGYVIDCLADATITDVLKPSVTMRINTNGHAITVNNSGGQIMSTTGNTDKIFDFAFDATGSTVTITGGSNANTQVFGWLFGDIESKTLKDSKGDISWYDSVSALPSASSNNGKYACLIKRDDTDLVEFAEIYKSNGTAWEIFSSDSPHGKLAIIGGTYVMNCSGISTYFIRLSFSHAEIDNVNVTVTNTHTESYSGTAPDGILKLVKLVCSTADIKSSTLNSYYTGNIDMHTSGIDIDECSIVSMDKVSMICDAPYHDNSGNSYGTYCCTIGRTCFAHVRNCNLNSMHSAIDNSGNCFVDGGIYESISHGGIYVTGRGVIIVQNAHIGAGTYTGLGELQYGMCAFTLGWAPTDKPTCFLHNCTLEAPSAKGFIAFRTAANANLYMSKTNIPANKMIRVDYVNAVGDNFEDMTDAEKPVIHVGNDCNVTLDMLACRTRAGNSKVEPPIKTQFTTTDAGKILFDSINSSSDEESIADADAIKNSLNITKENYAFFFSPYEWEKIVGSLMTFRSYITDISDIRDELNGINTLVGSGVIE